MFRGLKPRFIIFLVLILTLTIGVSSFLNLRLQYNQLMDISKEKLSDIAGTIDKSIRSSMEEGRSGDVKKIIQAVGTLQDLERVRIFSKHGDILVSSIPSEVGGKIDAGDLETFHKQNFSTVFDLKNLEQPIFYIIKPIMNEPACYSCHGTASNQINGVLEIEVSMDSVHARILEMRRFMFTSTLFTLFVLVLSILYLLSHLVNRPIQGLIQTMRKTENKDLTARVELDDTLEFEELGRNFNSMIARLEAAQNDLQRLHEKQMARVDRFATLGELAAGIAHEIKNPIAGIGGAIQILSQDLPENDYRREIFEEILKQINRIDQDIMDLLSYARTAKPEFGRYDIHKILQQAILLLRDRAAQQKVEIEVHYAEKIPSVEVDEKQIQQVIVNLGLNGIQAMKDGGTLKFSTRLHQTSDNEGLVEIEIEDTGQGIPKEKLSKIFTPFFTTRHTGTGLGLSICQKLIDQHQGTIEVSSDPDKGTCFMILLPLSKAPSEYEVEGSAHAT